MNAVARNVSGMTGGHTHEMLVIPSGNKNVWQSYRDLQRSSSFLSLMPRALLSSRVSTRRSAVWTFPREMRVKYSVESCDICISSTFQVHHYRKKASPLRTPPLQPDAIKAILLLLASLIPFISITRLHIRLSRRTDIPTERPTNIIRLHKLPQRIPPHPALVTTVGLNELALWELLRRILRHGVHVTDSSPQSQLVLWPHVKMPCTNVLILAAGPPGGHNTTS